MNKHLCWLMILLIIATGCKNEDEQKLERWITEELSISGDSPVPNRAGTRLLFRRESPNIGLFQFHLDSERESVVSQSTGIESYDWSNTGDLIVFSTIVGGTFRAAIDTLSEPDSIWAHGHNPRYLSGDTLIVCNGPADHPQDRGLYFIDMRSLTRIQFADSGAFPEPSPDGQKIGYLVPVIGLPGQTLLVYNRQTHFTQTLATNVYNFSWLNDSETIVFETLINEIQRIGTTSLAVPEPVIFANGTRPTGLLNSFDFAYTEITSDTISGFMIGSPSSAPVRIADFGINARATDESLIYAQGRNNLIRIRKILE